MTNIGCQSFQCKISALNVWICSYLSGESNTFRGRAAPHSWTRVKVTVRSLIFFLMTSQKLSNNLQTKKSFRYLGMSSPNIRLKYDNFIYEINSTQIKNYLIFCKQKRTFANLAQCLQMLSSNRIIPHGKWNTNEFSSSKDIKKNWISV